MFSFFHSKPSVFFLFYHILFCLSNRVWGQWAAGRIKEGWIYGEIKNTEEKTTPCLVPYDELPESEKEYDRNTAIETLKLIIKLGYKITRKDMGT
ncbi:RyR domain-containing protein [Ruminococcus callidus]|jgi:hypothetical protein|uniref:RyR domain-containing protein n=1 Tax=Ruminococcus callidus TaxID=40519 RepID=UPI000E46E541|nr:RyR domain-containing protein [Ruminococcus sp. AF37-20]RGF48554.1 Ryanodine receptor Ryr [Ruminococcus sp. AF37-20]